MKRHTLEGEPLYSSIGLSSARARLPKDLLFFAGENVINADSVSYTSSFAKGPR